MSEPVNLAIISNEPTPYRLHVLERVARELPGVRLHSLFTHAVESPSMPWKMNLSGEINAVGFPDERLTNGRLEPRQQLKLFARIRDYLVQQRVGLVILLGYNDLTRISLIRWAKKANVPLLLTGDSNVFSEGRVRGVKRFVKRRFVRWVVGSVAGLMPMGTCGRAFFRLYSDHDKPTFLFPYEPNYSILERRDEAAEAAFRKQHTLEDGRHRVLYCGRLIHVKRVDVLVDAFVQIAHDRPKWDLVIAGDGPLRQELFDRVPLPLRDRVKFLGFLQTHELALCYRSCDIKVLPSEYEPWALVINEAVASGLAVIATEMVGAAVELVRHGANGLIVPPRSPVALAEALRYATQPAVCQAMREAAPAVLAQWRAAADPVAGVRQALRHFRLIPAAE
ncbi:MAG: glycosyltransferase [Planctomycetota bacterium]|nr:glycosyltransferase [Planctomycetota bacterium]